jgi:hypothetical protein
MFRVTSIIEKAKNGDFGTSELEALKRITAEELVAIADYHDSAIRDFIIGKYFIAYNEDIVRLAKVVKSDLDLVFSNVWRASFLEKDVDFLLLSYVPIALLNTDLILRIRNAISPANLDDFESQIYNMIILLKEKRQEKTFLGTVFNIQGVQDDEMLEEMTSDDKIFAEDLLEKFDFLSTIWQFYLAKSKNMNANEDVQSIINHDLGITFIEKTCPQIVFEHVGSLFPSKEKEKDFSDILYDATHAEMVIVEVDKSEENITIKPKKEKKSSVFHKKLRSREKDTPKQNVTPAAARKKRYSIRAPEKTHYGRFVLVAVIIFMVISSSFVLFMNKVSDEKQIIPENIMLENEMKAKIVIKEKIKEE